MASIIGNIIYKINDIHYPVSVNILVGTETVTEIHVFGCSSISSGSSEQTISSSEPGSESCQLTVTSNGPGCAFYRLTISHGKASASLKLKITDRPSLSCISCEMATAFRGPTNISYNLTVNSFGLGGASSEIKRASEIKQDIPAYYKITDKQLIRALKQKRPRSKRIGITNKPRCFKINKSSEKSQRRTYRLSLRRFLRINNLC